MQLSNKNRKTEETIFHSEPVDIVACELGGFKVVVNDDKYCCINDYEWSC